MGLELYLRLIFADVVDVFIVLFFSLCDSELKMDPKSFYSSELRRKHAMLRNIPDGSDDSEIAGDGEENVDGLDGDWQPERSDISDSSDNEGNY